MFCFPTTSVKGPTPLEFVNATTQEDTSPASATIAMPSGIAEGDQILIFAGAYHSTPFNITASGYTQEAIETTVGDTNIYTVFALLSKTAGASEGSATVVMSGTPSGPALYVCVAYRPVTSLEQSPAKKAVNNTGTHTSNSWTDGPAPGVAVVGWFGNKDGSGSALGITTPPTMDLLASIIGAGANVDERLDVYALDYTNAGSTTKTMLYDTSTCGSKSIGALLT